MPPFCGLVEALEDDRSPLVPEASPQEVLSGQGLLQADSGDFCCCSPQHQTKGGDSHPGLRDLHLTTDTYGMRIND